MPRTKPGLFDRAARRASCAHRKRRLSPKFRFLCSCRFVRPGVAEKFSTTAPVSLYGATKLASEVLALDMPSVSATGMDQSLRGPGRSRPIRQARPGHFCVLDQFYLRRRPLRYIGFDGRGFQVRDCLHPRDLAALAWKQMQSPIRPVSRCKMWAVALLRPCHWLS